MEVSGQLHAPAALPQGKSLRYPLDRRLGGLQSRSKRGGEEKNSRTRNLSRVVKRPEREADRSLPPIVEVQNA
jgi:hypothetical protein